MSGGSFNYLCWAVDLEDLLAKRHQLESMAEELARLGYAPDAASEARALISDIRAAQVRVETAMDRLQGVFKAVEWWRSGDWGEDGVHEALEHYRGLGGGVHTVRDLHSRAEEPADGGEG